MEASVSKVISPNDRMRGNNPNDDSYLKAGKSVADTLKVVMTLAALEPKSILDYGCGYGRVLRWLRAYWPDAALSAADIEPDQIAFCANTFQATPILLDRPFPEIKLPSKYDVIWLGSIFTHIDEQSWRELIRVLKLHLNPRGVLCFSFAGRAVYRQIKQGERGGLQSQQEAAILQFLADFEEKGFGFLRQVDSNQRPWGRSVAKIQRVLNVLFELKAKVLLFSEQAYAGRQDVIALRFD